jgi:hypothetical protein
MCYLIYLTLIGIFLFYSDAILDQHALFVSAGDNQWMIEAIGWELLPLLWPILVLAMVLASAFTFFLTRLWLKRKQAS